LEALNSCIQCIRIAVGDGSGIPERHSALRSFPSWLRIEPRRHPDYFRVRGDRDIAGKPFLACVQRVVSKTPVGSASATPPAGSLTRLPSTLLGWIPCSDRCRARLAGSSEARRVWGEGQASRHDRAHIDQDGMWGQCGQVNPFWIARAYITFTIATLPVPRLSPDRHRGGRGVSKAFGPFQAIPSHGWPSPQKDGCLRRPLVRRPRAVADHRLPFPKK
jgi:hypothetical protein